MTDLNLASLNVRGLGNCQKRREIFNWLRAKGFSIYFLQETHSSEKSVSIWLAEWGYKALFNSCNSASAGVAILFNNNFFFELERFFSYPEGRFIICDIKVDRKVITLAIGHYTLPTRTTSSFLRTSLTIWKFLSAKKL